MTETIARVSTHGKGRRALDQALNHRRTFKTSGALSGRRADHAAALRWISTGQLRGADLDAWRRDRDRVVFVVLSYSTPIGWVVDDGSDRGEFYRVDQRFSVTTSKHQGMLWAVEQPAGHFDGMFG